MLVLSRKKGEKIRIGDNVFITVTELRGDRVRLGIEAPRDIQIHREEVIAAIEGLSGKEATKPSTPEDL